MNDAFIGNLKFDEDGTSYLNEKYLIWAVGSTGQARKKMEAGTITSNQPCCELQIDDADDDGDDDYDEWEANLLANMSTEERVSYFRAMDSF